MAPFLSHLVVGERVWLRLGGATGCQAYRKMLQSVQEPPQSAAGLADDPGHFGDGSYGSFLLGCLAPDVDKFCDGLEQSTTHFLPKDEENRFAWRRSEYFLEHTADYLRGPFCELTPGEQAFVLGYLCHVATDEITARHAIRIRDEMVSAGVPTPSIDSVLTAMDPQLWALAQQPELVVEALSGAEIPDGTLSFAPVDCLAGMHQIILPQVREGGGLIPYVNMVRRQWLWMRERQGAHLPQDDAALEEELDRYRRQIEEGMPASEQLVGGEDGEAFVEEAVAHSCQRICLLLDQECGQ